MCLSGNMSVSSDTVWEIIEDKLDANALSDDRNKPKIHFLEEDYHLYAYLRALEGNPLTEDEVDRFLRSGSYAIKHFYFRVGDKLKTCASAKYEFPDSSTVLEVTEITFEDFTVKEVETGIQHSFGLGFSSDFYIYKRG